MRASARALIALSASIVVTIPVVSDGNKSATALTFELARKCREMAVKAYPPVVAGSRQGTAQKERDYFRSCVAQSGRMDDQPPTENQKK
jgi:hypothetical protein